MIIAIMQPLPNPITEISLLLHLHFDAGHRGSSTTPSGHVLHYISDGQYQLSINKHEFTARRGDLILYHDVEHVIWQHNAVPVSFYSFVFQAPQLPPLDFSQRVQCSAHDYNVACKMGFDASDKNPAQNFQLFAVLHAMLGEMYQSYQAPVINSEADAWSRLEQELRRQQLFRPSLNQCSQLSGLSTATLNRYCRSIHNCSPLKRIQHIRMQHAYSLLQLSTMSISEIANYLDYPRVHEFSRECKQQFGKSPRALRQQLETGTED